MFGEICLHGIAGFGANENHGDATGSNHAHAD